MKLQPGDIPALLQKSRRALKSASTDIETGDDDSAMSRIYYAMFYGAEALLLTRGKVFARHQGVISAFGRYFVRTGIFPVEMQNRQMGKWADEQIGRWADRQMGR